MSNFIVNNFLYKTTHSNLIKLPIFSVLYLNVNNVSFSQPTSHHRINLLSFHHINMFCRLNF